MDKLFRTAKENDLTPFFEDPDFQELFLSFCEDGSIILPLVNLPPYLGSLAHPVRVPALLAGNDVQLRLAIDVIGFSVVDVQKIYLDLRRMLVGRGDELERKWPAEVDMVRGMALPDGRGRKRKE